MKKTQALALSCALLSGVFATSLPARAEDKAISPVLNLGQLSTSGKLSLIASFLADQLAQNRDLKNVSQSRVAVTSFVNLQALKETNKIGLLLSEIMIHDFQVRGFPVVDFKTLPFIQVTPTGDFIFSRRVDELRSEYNINYFLTGTYTNNSDGVVINARLLDARSALVVSTAQAFIPARDAARLLAEFREAPTEKIYIDRPVVPAVPPNSVSLRAY